MWNRFQERLRCVACGSRLALKPVVERKAKLTTQQLERADRQGIAPKKRLLARLIKDCYLVRSEEVKSWFEKCGFTSLHHVQPTEVPPSAVDNIVCGVGLQGECAM